MENKKKVSKHFLADRIPLILSAVLMLAGAFLPNMIISSIIEPFYNESNGITLQIIWCIGVVILSFICLILFDKWFSPEYESSMRSEGLTYGLKLLLPVIIFWTVWMAELCRYCRNARDHDFYDRPIPSKPGKDRCPLGHPLA